MSLQPVPFTKKQAPQPRLSPRYVPGRHAESHWREEEDALLRAHYPTGGLAACLEKLPRRSGPAIYGRANHLGLKSARQAGSRRKRQDHGPALDAKIVAAWPTLVEKGAVQRFADELGIDRWVISRRAVALGLTKDYRRKEPDWTAAEDALLRKVPLHAPTRASRIFTQHGFRRSPTALLVRAQRIGLSCRRADMLSATAAAKILGVDAKWITARCIDGSLVAAKRGTRRLVQQGGDTWSIRPRDLRAYVIERLEEVDIRKVEKFAFVALLTAGPDEDDPGSGERDDGG